MVAVVAIIAFASLSPVATPPSTVAQTTPTAVSVAAIDPEVEQAARQWLVLVDAGHWRESWNATGQAFRKLVTHQQWASV